MRKIDVTIPEHLIQDFEKMASKAAKKINGLYWETGEVYSKTFFHIVDGHREKWQHKVVDVALFIPDVIGWTLLATVVEGALFVTNHKEKLELTNGHGADYGFCDVCKHKQWKKSFIIKNDTTGEELQVGSECAKKFGIGLVEAIYKLTSELYANYNISFTFSDFEDDMCGGWPSHLNDPYAVRSVETSVLVQAAKKYYDDNNGKWIKGYYQGRSYIPSESAQIIRNSLKEFEAEEDNNYYQELCDWLTTTFVASGEFDEKIKDMGSNFYMSAGDSAVAFFAIKRYEQYKKEQAAKEAGLYLPKRGDFIHIVGKVVGKEIKSGYYGDYMEYEIFNELDNNTYKRAGAVREDSNGSVNCYAFIDDIYKGIYRLGRTLVHPKKGYAIANV